MSSGSKWLVTKDDWDVWSESYEWLPIIVKQPLRQGFKIDTWERAWAAGGPHAFVLESGKEGRYTYLGLNPTSMIYGKGDQCVTVDCSGSQRQRANPLAAVQAWMKRVKAPIVEKAPIFYGGAVGFWGYDIARSIERLPVIASDDFGLPDYCFYQMNELWIVDHEQSALYIALHRKIDGQTNLSAEYDQAKHRIFEMAELWKQLSEPSEHAAARKKRYEAVSAADRLTIDIDAIAGLETSFNKTEFAQAVEKIQAYIRQGDVFQVNLSTRQSLPLTEKETPEELYEWLRMMNPSPYMGLFKHQDFQLVSASPELLVKLHQGHISTKPIAGTRKRGHNVEEDRALQEELVRNDKERAEHIMLVDLLRNDVGKVSAYGTVRVQDLMSVETYSHVMHLVSEVTGELAEHKDAFDILAAVFPGGTITGAPKVRTMEIIEELEPVRRGPYTGSIGWIDYQGNMEFNIVIRTLTIKDQVGHVQAGAGIVIDSDPVREYEESLNKAKALWKAVEYSRLFSAEEEAR